MLEDPLAEGLIYEATLPLAWQLLDGPPDSIALQSQGESNESFLRALAALDHHAESSEEPETLHPELVRLDLKINLLMELVGQALSVQLSVPPPVRLRFNAHGVEWTGADLPPQGRWVRIQLYLKPEFPRPLVTFGQVLRAESGAATVAFEGIGEAVEDGLEKMIFRHHRRVIAQHRAARRP